MRTHQSTGKGQGAEEQHGPRKRQENSVGRVRPGEPAREVPESPMKGGRKVQRAAPVNMPALVDLSSELLEEIFVKITYLEDVIALSSTCCCLAALVEHPRQEESGG